MMIKVPRGYLKANHPIMAVEAERISAEWKQATRSGKTLVLYDIDFVPLPPQPTKKVKRRNRNL